MFGHLFHRGEPFYAGAVWQQLLGRILCRRLPRFQPWVENVLLCPTTHWEIDCAPSAKERASLFMGKRFPSGLIGYGGQPSRCHEYRRRVFPTTFSPLQSSFNPIQLSPKLLKLPGNQCLQFSNDLVFLLLWQIGGPVDTIYILHRSKRLRSTLGGRPVHFSSSNVSGNSSAPYNEYQLSVSKC